MNKVKFLTVFLTRFLIFTSFVNVAEVNLQGFSFIGNGIEAHDPCGNGFLTMQRVIGGPPEQANYWDGRISLGEAYSNRPETRVSLKLDAPARILLAPNEGRVFVENGAFQLAFYKKNGTFFTLKFRVQGEPSKKFPNLKMLTFNGADVCPDITPWKPSILGAPIEGNNPPPVVEPKVDAPLIFNSVPCGQRTIKHQGLITSGLSTFPGEWPWHVAIFHQSGSAIIKYKCGGTLISNEAVITAAHCVYENGAPINAQRVIVKSGLHHRLLSNRNTQEFIAYKIIPHNEFNSSYFQNDIAIIKLSTLADFTDFVRPACLWPRRDIELSHVIDQTGYVVGWGIFENETLADYLHQGTMPIVSLTRCLESKREFFGAYVSDTNYCAGFRDGMSVCNGDSGGGMFLKDENTYTIRGIVSVSVSQEDKNICNPKEYVVFTDVAKYLDWIIETLK